MLAEVFKGRDPDLTEENLQARIRGNLLMALSNKFGWLVLTTSNKSESSVGYSTLYGDSAGGFAVIKDVPKTLVYKLVEHRNAEGVVPASIIERPPSAELRAEQKDSGFAARLRHARHDPRARDRGGREPAPARARGPAARGDRPRHRADRPCGVQTAPGAAGDQDHAARLRP